MSRFAGAIRQEEFTLPSGDTVLIRPLTASEASDIGIGGTQTVQLSGPQIRKAICRASRDPKFIDDENPTNGAISVYALTAEDELALLNKIMDLSYGKLIPKETAQVEPFPPRGGETPSGVRPDTPTGDGPAAS
jgi:hypothetical protein